MDSVSLHGELLLSSIYYLAEDDTNDNDQANTERLDKSGVVNINGVAEQERIRQTNKDGQL